MLEACLDLRRGLGNPVDIAATLSTLALVRLHEGDADRARACDEEAARHLPRARRPDRRGDRAASPRRDLHATSATMPQARELFRAVPRHRPRHRAPRARRRVRADAGRARAGGGRPAGGTRAVRALARGLPGRRRQARRSDRAVVDSARPTSPAATATAARIKLGEALRAFQAFEMNAEVLELPRGSSPNCCSPQRPRRRRGSPVRGGGGGYRERLALTRPPRA